MMICRCPGCGTPFRVTPQQIKVRNGLVRCGECKIVFNALDQLVEGQESRPTPAAPQVPLANVTATLGRTPSDDDPRDLAAHLAPLQAAQATARAATHAGEPQTAPAPAVDPIVPASSAHASPDARADHEDAAPDVPTDTFEHVAAGTRSDLTDAASALASAPLAEPVHAPAPPVPRPAPDPDTTPDATPSADETREAALAAGLVAPRELRTAPGYSRWAETALSKGGGPRLNAPPRSLGWLYATLGVVLGLLLAAQAIHHYRTEVATRWPASRAWLEKACAALACEVALPRQADLISIEASDLHSDPDRGGLLVLQATLRNRAPFAQALPALELTITDTEDRAVARRVLRPEEYLDAQSGSPAAAAGGSAPNTPTAFAGHGELDIRLWIDARDVGAAGYRLYLFYP